MERLSIFSCVLLFLLCVVYGAEKQRLAVVDYFLLLPQDYFEEPPAG
jgi:hypothetical protein